MGFFHYKPGSGTARHHPPAQVTRVKAPLATTKLRVIDEIPADSQVIRLFAEIRRAHRINEQWVEKEAWCKLAQYLSDEE
jgi:hypothetical protein